MDLLLLACPLNPPAISIKKLSLKYLQHCKKVDSQMVPVNSAVALRFSHKGGIVLEKDHLSRELTGSLVRTNQDSRQNISGVSLILIHMECL